MTVPCLAFVSKHPAQPSGHLSVSHTSTEQHKGSTKNLCNKTVVDLGFHSSLVSSSEGHSSSSSSPSSTATRSSGSGVASKDGSGSVESAGDGSPSGLQMFQWQAMMASLCGCPVMACAQHLQGSRPWPSRTRCSYQGRACAPRRVCAARGHTPGLVPGGSRQRQVNVDAAGCRVQKVWAVSGGQWMTVMTAAGPTLMAMANTGRPR